MAHSTQTPPMTTPAVFVLTPVNRYRLPFPSGCVVCNDWTRETITVISDHRFGAAACFHHTVEQIQASIA